MQGDSVKDSTGRLIFGKLPIIINQYVHSAAFIELLNLNNMKKHHIHQLIRYLFWVMYCIVSW